MSSTKVIISRARGAAMGQALFESSSFFNSDDFLKLMGLDDYHPLIQAEESSVNGIILKHFLYMSLQNGLKNRRRQSRDSA